MANNLMQIDVAKFKFFKPNKNYNHDGNNFACIGESPWMLCKHVQTKSINSKHVVLSGVENKLIVQSQ
jgi:hypothetical protein